jgi:hypothetical protein
MSFHPKVIFPLETASRRRLLEAFQEGDGALFGIDEEPIISLPEPFTLDFLSNRFSQQGTLDLPPARPATLPPDFIGDQFQVPTAQPIDVSDSSLGIQTFGLDPTVAKNLIKREEEREGNKILLGQKGERAKQNFLFQQSQEKGRQNFINSLSEERFLEEERRINQILEPQLGGIIPAGGPTFQNQLEFYFTPITFVGGMAIDMFNEVKAAPRRVKTLADITLDDPSQFLPTLQAYRAKNIAAQESGIISFVGQRVERQRARSGWARFFSEAAVDPILAPVVFKIGSGVFKEIVKALPRTLPRFRKDIAGVARFSFDERLNQLRGLEDFGLKGVADENEYLAPLRDLETIITEITTSGDINHPLVLALLSKSGINPQVAQRTPVGRAITGYQIQQVNIENIINVVMSALFDSKMQRFTGRMRHILPIGPDGIFKGTGKAWQDVFSNPQRYDLNQSQMDLIDDYNWATNVEAKRILDDVGLDISRLQSLDPEAPYYVPRNVYEIAGIELRRHSDPLLQRHYEDATDGLAANIKYEDPRSSLELYLRWVYKTAARKQLDDALAPYAISAKQLVPTEIREGWESALKAQRFVEQIRRRVRKAIVTVEHNLRIANTKLGLRQRSLTETQKDIDRLDELLEDLNVLPYEKETIPVRIEKPRGRTEQVIKREIRVGTESFQRLDNQLRGVVETPENTDRFQAMRAFKVKVDQAIEELREQRAKPKFRREGIKPEPERRRRIRVIGKATQARTEYKRVVKRGARKTGLTQTAENQQFNLQDWMRVLKLHLESIDDLVRERTTDKLIAKNKYDRSLEEFKGMKAEVAPGKLFGPDQPDKIPIASWRHKYLTREDADLLNDKLSLQGVDVFDNKFFNSLEIAGNTVRFLSAVGDFAMPFIQGLPVLATDPEAWGRMVTRHYMAFFDPSVQFRLVRENITDYQWLARNGVPIGDPEFFAALQKGHGISFDRLYKKLGREDVQRFMQGTGRQTFGRYQAAYNTGLGYSRLMLYKGLKTGWKGTDAELAQYLRNLTGGLDSRALGVAPKQRAAEGMWMAFSPRLLRSTTALVFDALFHPTTRVGKASFRSIANLSMGVTATYVHTGVALGKTWEEILEGLNPLNGKRFLSYQINEDWIGVGGQIRALTQLIVGVTIGLFTNPENMIKLDPYENPFIKFLAGRGAPTYGIVGGFVEAFTGINALPYEEIDGPIDLAKHLGKSVFPFAAKGAMEGEKIGTVAFAQIGARTSPETKFEKELRAKQLVMAETGVDGEYKDIESREDKRLVDSDPRVVEAAKQTADLNLKRKDVVELYKRDLDKNKTLFEDRINQAAAQKPPSKELRDIIGMHQREEFIEAGNIKLDHPDAQKIFDEIEPKTALEFVVLREFFEAIEKADLDNKITGEYDFQTRDEIVSKFEGKYGKVVMDQMFRDNRADDTEIEKELRQDRESLRHYWDANERVKARFSSEVFQSTWDTYLTLKGRERRDYKQRYVNIINPMERARDAMRLFLRKNNPEIDVLLLKWEYVLAPQTPEGIEKKVELLEPFRESLQEVR